MDDDTYQSMQLAGRVSLPVSDQVGSKLHPSFDRSPLALEDNEEFHAESQPLPLTFGFTPSPELGLLCVACQSS